jgi:hypothetical protein
MKNNSLKKFVAGFFSLSMLLSQLFIFSTTETQAAVNRAVTIQSGLNASTEVSASVCNSLRLRASVALTRAGSDNTYARKRIRMELINPNGQTVDFAVAEIGRESNQTINGDTGSENGTTGDPYRLTAPAAFGGSGCSTWRVRLLNVDTNNAVANQQVTGTVSFYTVGSITETISAPAKFGIVQSDTVERNISVPFTGDITIQANWDTDEISLQNYQLKFSLIRPDGTVVDSDTGYSRDSIIVGVSDSQRMKITYRITCADLNSGSGSWKIRVKGSSLGKVKNVDLKMKISDGLF